MTMIKNVIGVAPVEGQAIYFLGTLMTVKATGASTQGAFGLIEQALPGGFTTPLHVHHNEDEAFYLLEGTGVFTCGGESFRAQAGSYIFFPRDVPHWFQIDAGETARLLQWNFPAGLEQFFIEAGEPALELALPGPQPPDLDKMLTLAPKYGMEILGPPPVSSAA